jgi:hypothetical protein
VRCVRCMVYRYHTPILAFARAVQAWGGQRGGYVHFLEARGHAYTHGGKPRDIATYYLFHGVRFRSLHLARPSATTSLSPPISFPPTQVDTPMLGHCNF